MGDKLRQSATEPENSPTHKSLFSKSTRTDGNSNIFSMDVSLVDVQGQRCSEVFAAKAGVFDPVCEKMPENIAKTLVAKIPDEKYFIVESFFSISRAMNYKSLNVLSNAPGGLSCDIFLIQ